LLIQSTFDEQSAQEYTSKVLRSLMNEVFLTGTPDHVIKQAAEWREHGLRHLIVANSSGMQRSLRKATASSVPFNTVLRGLKRL
jgi:phthiodiolone/phenolphthiodiolone dimycocerosates ketoreductase